ncbi:peptidylprolyl isomerase [Paenibacillus thiaminolyticus]|uniref:peptidylprolyl isomerase n=1 Tax=Paenibacillus thiaminolyticus TaxID=49283 RepID=UPI0025429B64|nr:peptidylprolyl isomerase [Paenibacillus thiaminolyticus]WII39830.1 peptidylprolyl isomerase [Paenibacillus thiaminolyticus]
MRRSNRQRTSLTLIALLIISMMVVAGCGSKAGNASGADSAKHPLVTIEMESGKKIEVELYPDTAPNTVNNFISLVNKGFYDGLIFHRVIPGFMIQGGDPQGTGIGGPGYSIKGEFSSNGVTNDLKHTEGVLSMARSMDPDSAGSQFFIMDADAPHLDGQYAAFGKVTSGIETVHEIANVNRDATDRPVEDQKIKKITVDTFGVEYKEPETIKEPESK